MEGLEKEAGGGMHNNLVGASVGITRKILESYKNLFKKYKGSPGMTQVRLSAE